jgi:hypothetical protein
MTCILNTHVMSFSVIIDILIVYTMLSKLDVCCIMFLFILITHVFVITVLWVINKCGHTSFPTDLILLAIDVTDNPIYLYYTYKYRQYDDQRGTLQSRDTRPWYTVIVCSRSVHSVLINPALYLWFIKDVDIMSQGYILPIINNLLLFRNYPKFRVDVRLLLY